MATRRRTAASLRVVLKGRHDAPNSNAMQGFVYSSKNPKQGKQGVDPNNSARLPEGCVPHRKPTLLEAFQRAPPKGSTSFRRRWGLTSP
jgi:hypothetical protein